MFSFKRVISALMFVFVIAAAGLQTPGQNMSGTVVERRIKFGKGKSSTTLRGNANYGMSYVYNLGARRGQNMSVQLTSARGVVTFSLIAPDSQTIENAFLVRSWTGDLPQSGDYSIVVVMNDEKSSNIPFTLAVTIK